jgi:hypothetical protein
MSSKYKNKRRAIQENLSIDLYVFLRRLSYPGKVLYIFRAAELPRQSVYMENIYLA